MLKTPHTTLGSSLHKTLWCLVVSCVVVCTPLQALALEKVTLQLKWRHAFQFAGYYAAKARGYYRDAGIDVNILEADPTTNVVEQVVHNKSQYGVGTSSLLLSYAQGKPVVALAVIFQHSPQVLLARKEPGITSVRDLAGKRIMLEAQSDELRAYLMQEGVHTDTVAVVPHTFSQNDLQRGTISAMSAYLTYEPFFMDQAGIKYQLFSPRSVGIDFYGDNLFTSRQEIQLHPQRVQAFREASLKGWKYALEHPEEIVDLIRKEYSPDHSTAFLLFEAEQVQSVIKPGLVEIGYMSPDRWQHIAKTYAGLGLVNNNIPDLGGFIYKSQTDKHEPLCQLKERWWILVLLLPPLILTGFYLRCRFGTRKTNYRHEQKEPIMPAAPDPAIQSLCQKLKETGLTPEQEALVTAIEQTVH